jgi:hypothetical protein
MRKTIVRGVIGLLVVLLIIVLILPMFPGALAVVAMGTRLLTPAPATPPPPQIDAPRGDLPEGIAGLQQWRQNGDVFKAELSSGFLLELSSGEIIGVTTAHGTYDQPDPYPTMARMGLGINGADAPVVESDTYYGHPGTPRTGNDVTVDYVLLKLDAPDPTLALTADPRGKPLPGERIVLYSGLGDQRGGVVTWGGTVLSVEPTGIKLLMDQSTLFPGGMSGSPVFSEHTGLVIGMLIAGTTQGSRWVLDVHPIWHLVEVAESAMEFPKMLGYER